MDSLNLEPGIEGKADVFTGSRNTGLTGFILISDDISSKSGIMADIRRSFCHRLLELTENLARVSIYLFFWLVIAKEL